MKCLFYLFAMLCTLSLFSCGDDDKKDEPKPDESWKKIVGDYSGDKLKLQLNGTDVTTGSINLETTSAEKGTVSLGTLIAGASDIKVEVDLKATKTDVIFPAYTFEGQTKTDSRSIAVNGFVMDGVLSLKVDLKVESSIVGKWGLAPYKKTDLDGDGIPDEDYNLANGGFFLYMETVDEKITFMGKTVKTYDFCVDADKKAEAFLTASLQDVTFLEDGNVVFTYMKEDQAVPLAGVAGYYVKDHMLYMTLNLSAIIEMLKGTKTEFTLKDTGPNEFEQLYKLLKDGIPFAYVPEEGGNTCMLMINMDMAIRMLPVMNSIFRILPYFLTGKPELAGLFDGILGLVNDIPSYDRFEVGFNLIKK